MTKGPTLPWLEFTILMEMAMPVSALKGGLRRGAVPDVPALELRQARTRLTKNGPSLRLALVMNGGKNGIYCNSFRTCCGAELACARAAIPAWSRSCDLVKFADS